MPTDDGYPTEEELKRIVVWPCDDLAGWLAFIKSCWWAADWGWHEEDADDEFTPGRLVHRYNISTGGWSGNESIIDAMRENFALWHLTWHTHRRGGHYIFERPR